MNSSIPRNRKSVAMLALCVGASTFVIPRLVLGVDTFNYKSYPVSAMKAPSECSGKGIDSQIFKIGNVEHQSLSQHSPSLKPGATIEWKAKVLDAACSGQPFSLVFYATNGQETGVETITAQSVGTLGTASSSVSLQIPKFFVGPYRLAAVIGRPLPRVGAKTNFYESRPKDVNNDDIGADRRNMLVQSLRSVMDAKAPTFIDMADTDFTYGEYPESELKILQDCSASDVNDQGAELGFFIDGVRIGNNFGQDNGKGAEKLKILRPGQKIEYKFKMASSKCNRKELSLTLYRNPEGGAGMFMDKPLRLVTKDTVKMIPSNDVNILKIDMPTYFSGGFILNVVLGSPLPIVGDIAGRYYSSTRKVNLSKVAGNGLIKE